MTQRTERVDELLRQEIGQIVARELGDPDVGFATITDVETTPDLRHARVWVSVIGQPEARQASIAALQRAMPFIRAQLGKRLRIRRIPEFSVRLDESVERGSRVLKLLSEIEAGELPGELPRGESLPTPVKRLPHEGETVDPIEPAPVEVPRHKAGGRQTAAGSGRSSGRDRGPATGRRR